MRTEKTFSSFDEFLKQINLPRTEGAGTVSSKHRPRQSWTLGAGWKESLELARKGWPEGTAKVKAAAELLELPSGVRGYEPQPMAALSGDEVDVGLYLSGEPECMTDWVMAETPSFGKVVKVIVHLTGTAGVSAEALMYRGLLACLLIDTLEASGLRCEVWGLPKCSADNGGDDPKYLAHVLLKPADEPVELDRLAFMLAHPAVFRRFGFRLMEQEPEGSWAYEESTGSYGVSVPLPEAERRAEDGILYIGGGHLSYSSDAAVIKAAQDIAKQYLVLDEEGAAA